MIGKLKLATPGRLGNYTDDNADDTAAKTEKKSDNGQAERIIALLGGRENIVLVDACMTRLRVTVKDLSLIHISWGHGQWRGHIRSAGAHHR